MRFRAQKGDNARGLCERVPQAEDAGLEALKGAEYRGVRQAGLNSLKSVKVGVCMEKRELSRGPKGHCI